MYVLYLFPVLPKPQVSYKTTSPGVIEANCTAVARPQAEIVWNVEGNNRTIGPPVSTAIQQSDGTTLVISTLTVQAGLLKDVSVKCLVHHKGLETAIAVSMNTKSKCQIFTRTLRIKSIHWLDWHWLTWSCYKDKTSERLGMMCCLFLGIRQTKKITYVWKFLKLCAIFWLFL